MRKTEQATEPPIEDLSAEKMLRPADAARYLGVDKSTLNRAVRDGYLTPEVREGDRLYRVADLDEARSVLGAKPELNLAQYLAVLVQHERDLIKLLIEPYRDTMKVLTEENLRLRQGYFGAIEAREAALDHRADRELATVLAGQQIERQEKGIALLEQIVAKIVAQVGASGTAAQMVRDLPPEIWQALGSYEDLKPQARAALESLRGEPLPQLEAAVSRDTNGKAKTS